MAAEHIDYVWLIIWIMEPVGNYHDRRIANLKRKYTDDKFLMILIKEGMYDVCGEQNYLPYYIPTLMLSILFRNNHLEASALAWSWGGDTIENVLRQRPDLQIIHEYRYNYDR